MFSNKTIVKLVSTGGLILFASLAGAQTYTSVPVKYEDGWWLEFKDEGEPCRARANSARTDSLGTQHASQNCR